MSNTERIDLLIILVPLPKYQSLVHAQTTSRDFFVDIVQRIYWLIFCTKIFSPYNTIEIVQYKTYPVWHLSGWRTPECHSQSSSELLILLNSFFFTEIMKNIREKCNLDLELDTHLATTSFGVVSERTQQTCVVIPPSGSF